MNLPTPISPLVVADATAWREWLQRNESRSDGVWLTLAKKGATSPTSLAYQDALEEALCSGWIDGQRRRLDASAFLQRFTPRRPGSVWSRRNVDIATRLADQDRLREAGIAQIEQAQADGRWERAYPGAATAQIPADLADALAANPAAQTAFTALNRADRYTALHAILTAPNPPTRARRIESLIRRLN